MRPLCASAWELSRRSTAELTPTQGEIDDALELVRTAGKPLYAQLGHLPFAAPWYGQPTELSAEVTNSVLADAWGQGRIVTGVEPVDSVLDAIGAKNVTLSSGRYLSIKTHRAIATRNVQRALEDVPGLAVGYDDNSVNAFWTDIADEGVDPEDGGHRVRFQIGWFNCPVGCSYLHFWRTKVLPGGDVVLVLEWGEPIPPDVLQQWAPPEP